MADALYDLSAVIVRSNVVGQNLKGLCHDILRHFSEASAYVDTLGRQKKYPQLELAAYGNDSRKRPLAV